MNGSTGYSFMHLLFIMAFASLCQVISAQSVNIKSLQQYTPSFVLAHGRTELKLFNNIYTHTALYNRLGDRIAINRRETYYAMFFHMLYGISKSGRVNIGVDINYRAVRYASTGSSPFEVLTFQNSTASRATLSTVGPKIKLNPIARIPNLSVQSAFWVPVANDLQGSGTQPYLDFDGYTWWTQFFYDHTWGTKLYMFLEGDILLRADRKGDHSNSQLHTPVSGFFSYFPTNKSAVYGMVQWSPVIGSGAYFVQSGLGMKYYLIPSLEIELLHTGFIAGINTGAGKTFNLGFRFLR